MDVIKALSIGAEAIYLREWKEAGYVHSVFSRVINLAFPGLGLLSVSKADVSNSPTNIVTNLKGHCGWPDLGIDARAKTVIAGNYLCLGSVCVDLSAANIWLPSIRSPLAALPSREIEHNILRLHHGTDRYITRQGLSPLLPYLNELLAGGCPPVPHDDPFLKVAAIGIADLIKAIKLADLPAISHHARGLIGLGPGLTPSGDDLLAGIMAGMAFSQKVTALLPLVPAEQINQAIVSQVKGRTNDISHQLLEFSARGEVAETMEAVILAILQGPEDQLEKAADLLVKVGASSGTDQLLGIMLGISLYFIP